jgi:outer membrane protein assembly factor BamB
MVATVVGHPAGASVLAAGVKLSPKVGPPTTITTVSGKGFGATEPVDLRFDQTPVGSATTDPTGAFSAPITVPAPALPGTHSVSARGQISHVKASAAFLVRTDWTKFHFDPANTGVNPYENVLGTSTVGGLALAWKQSGTPFLPVITSSLAVVGGRVFVGATDATQGDAYVDAFDALSGELLWQVFIAYAAPVSGMAVAGGLVYFGTGDDHSVYAVDAATGVIRWSFYSGWEAMNTPVVVDGVVYVGGAEHVFALDARNGHRLWTFDARDPVAGAPAVVDGVVYFGSEDHRIYAVDADTGQKLWSFATGDVVTGAPLMANGVVYVGSWDHFLYAIDASTHSILWTADTGYAMGSAAFADGVVYIPAGSTMYAFDGATGEPVWSTPTDNGMQDPFVANGVLYAGSFDDSVYAFDAAIGAQLWSYPTGSPLARSGAVVDGRVYTGSQDGYLYAFTLP